VGVWVFFFLNKKNKNCGGVGFMVGGGGGDGGW
jgi:hypothetical protein